MTNLQVALVGVAIAVAAAILLWVFWLARFLSETGPGQFHPGLYMPRYVALERSCTRV